MSVASFETLLSSANRYRVISAIEQMNRRQSPYVRPRVSAAVRQQPRNAAVLVPFILIHKEPALLYTLRSSHLVQHRGEVSFPGGLEDPTDGGDVVCTALRETREELNLELPDSSVDVWGALPSLTQSTGRNLVTPVLARLPIDHTDLENIRPNPDEVQLVFARSLRYLCESGNQGSTFFRWRPDSMRSVGGYTIPLYDSEPPRIWGLTAVITHLVLNLVAGQELYQYKIRQHRR